MKIKVGDRLDFWKFRWTITRIIPYISGHVEYRYRVHRKYLKRWLPLSYTEQDYPISAWRWNFLKEQLRENPRYHYNMHLWSNAPRRKLSTPLLFR